MAYLGLQPNTPLLNTSTEYISGNGILLQFTLSRSVASASDIDVMIGSTLQRPGTDYTAGGITLLFYAPPVAGTNNITVTYRAGALNSLDLTVNTFNAGTVAAPGVVSLAANNTGIYWAAANSMSVTVSGTNRATFNANATSINTSTGALVINGGIGAGGNINTSGRISITDTTESANINSGSLTTAGGAAVTGNLNVGGDITCVGDFTVNGTFTTTGADSLTVTDPFIFLANANPGDSFDTGVIAQYFDGANTRYTGYFRDITDAKYKFFTNLLTKPTTIVDADDPSFRLTDVVVANLSASGNVTGTYFIGNGSALTGISTDTTKIFNANSKVEIAAVNANVNMVVNAIPIANVWSGGISVVGAIAASTTLSATANIVGGNIQTAGVFSSTGNITSAANVSGGNILTGGEVISSGNVRGSNVNATASVSAVANIAGGNVRSAGVVSAVGDLFGNNINATTNLTAGADANVTGNVNTGNVFSTGVVSAVGNITGSVFLGNGSQLTGINATGIQLGTSNVKIATTNGNVTINVGGTSNVAVFGPLNANITGNLGVSSGLSVAGGVTFGTTTDAINIGTNQTTGTIEIGGINQSGTITIGSASGASQTLFLASGAVGTSIIKTVSIGEGSVAGGTTLINIGPATSTTAAGTATFNTATVVSIANTSGSALSVVGNIIGGNINTAGAISVTGNITSGNLNAIGISLTGNVASPISTASNITGGNLNAIGISLSGNVVSALVSAANITTTANINGGNIMFGAGAVSGTGNIITTGNIAGGNVIGTLVGSVAFGAGSVSGTGNITGGNVIGTLVGSVAFNAGSVSGTGNITGGNVLFGTGVVSGTGNITGGNLLTSGLISATSSITAGSIQTGGAISATGNITGGNLSGTGIVGTLLTGPQTNITSVGTLGSLTVTANVTGGNIATGGAISAAGAITGAGITGTSLNISTGTANVGGITNANLNGIGNIGNATVGFNTVFATATSARYADLAELYAADAEYAPGTVLDFGGSDEVTLSTGINSVRVAGVVSTNPAHLMNSTLQSEHTAALALVGRVPTLVVGAVKKGDMMVTAGGGRAQACAEPRMGSVIGKALQDHPGGQGVIEIVVGRM
jgi:hypothetical protein